MSISMYLILFGIILMLVDIFFQTDIPTFIAYLIFSLVFFINIPLHLLVRIILTIIFFFVLLLFHYFLWKKTIQLLIDTFFAKDIYKAGFDGLIGKKGIVRIIEGKKLAYIQGDLYKFRDEISLKEGEGFIVKNTDDGYVII